MIFFFFFSAQSEVYYLHLQLEEKPQLQNTVVIDLPEGIFFDSSKKEQFELWHRPSPMTSELSFACSVGKNSLAASVNALVEECRTSHEPGQVDIKISQQKLEISTEHRTRSGLY